MLGKFLTGLKGVAKRARHSGGMCPYNHSKEAIPDYMIVTLTKTREHITPVLFDLHWLPVRQRTMYTLGLFVYKILNDLAPCYLTDLIELYAPGRSGLRSSNQLLLAEHQSRNHWGERSFRFAAATLWNSFPSDVRLSPSLPSFKKNFKTFLFKDAFELYLWTCIVILLYIYLFPLWLLFAKRPERY